MSAESGVFVSHASQDAELVEAFVKMLLLGGVPNSQVFSTHKRSSGVPAGASFGPYIRTKLATAALTVQLITPIYLTRPYCLAEAGAQWVLEKPTFPIVVPPLLVTDVKGVLEGVQMVSLAEPSTYAELHDELERTLEIRLPMARWDSATREFVSNIDSLVSRLQRPDLVPRSEYETALLRLESVTKETASTSVQGTEVTSLQRASSQIRCRPTEMLVGEDSSSFDLTIRGAGRIALIPSADEGIRLNARTLDAAMDVVLDTSALRMVQDIYRRAGGVGVDYEWKIATANSYTVALKAELSQGLRKGTAARARTAVALPSYLSGNEVRFVFDLDFSRRTPSPLLSMQQVLQLSLQCLNTAAVLLPNAVIPLLVQEDSWVPEAVELHFQSSKGPLSTIVSLDELGQLFGEPPRSGSWAATWSVPDEALIRRAVSDIAMDWGYIEAEEKLSINP